MLDAFRGEVLRKNKKKYFYFFRPFFIYILYMKKYLEAKLDLPYIRAANRALISIYVFFS
ncbi:MAG: hypothetical protein AVDCRST_MAG96-923 [uncultured Segetibacter sp.]|uniref:Uncharacterized protein n=1 Tax=uncultured Segetibacter sp. TaxID=481133 RepID=A0A6J4RWF1_9BACT|nr:MAG: hypothetical protein AVDCRST_MAG96-923 [uncultured Segetibacter sp.]